jgi:hypothetical protein
MQREAKMLRDFWSFAKKEYGSIIPITIATITAIMGFIKITSVEYLLSAAIIVLALIVPFIRSNKEEIKSLLENEVFTLRKEHEVLKGLIDSLIGRRLMRYSGYREEIESAIEKADEADFLLHTGDNFLRTYKKSIENILEKQKGKPNRKPVRTLTWDPREPHRACDMAEEAIMRNPWNKVPPNIREKAERYLENVSGESKIEAKVIDYMAAWTLLIINPNMNNDKAVIYVELVEHLADRDKRPTFKLTLEDGEWFYYFKGEFDRMFKFAEPWPPKKMKKNEKK